MRTFFCLAFDDATPEPMSATILAADEWRARALAQREILAARHARRLEIWEGRKLLCVESQPT